MWEREDSQEVGSEAAILKRVRNSSLVEWSCADNVTGLKSKAEAADFHSARASDVQSNESLRWFGAEDAVLTLGSHGVGVVGERRSC
jgi:hypothetical protein